MQDNLEILDLKVPLDQLATLEHQEALDLEGRQDQLGLQAALVSLELWVPVDRLDQLEYQAL